MYATLLFNHDIRGLCSFEPHKHLTQMPDNFVNNLPDYFSRISQKFCNNEFGTTKVQLYLSNRALKCLIFLSVFDKSQVFGSFSLSRTSTDRQRDDSHLLCSQQQKYERDNCQIFEKETFATEQNRTKMTSNFQLIVLYRDNLTMKFNYFKIVP